MAFFIKILVLILAILMFVVKPKYKLSTLVFSCICLDSVIVDFVPFGGAQSLLSITFFLSELPHLKTKISEIRSTPIYRLLLMMVCATFILVVFSPHYHDIYNIIRLLIMELLCKYFALAYGFFCVRRISDLRPTIKVIIFSLAIVTILGFMNLYTKQSLWINILYPKGIDVMDDFSVSDRFRVQSMFANPFCYGYICSLLMSLFLFFHQKKILNGLQYVSLLLMCVFGIVYCGCRTNILVCFLGVLFFYYYILSSRKKIKYLSFSVLGLIISLFLFRSHIPSLLDYWGTAFVVDTDAGAKGLGGSSIAMRLIQLYSVFTYINGHWLFGRGLDFFSIDIGWSSGDAQTAIDEGLFGLEGVYLSLLLERGIVGFLFWLIFYCVLFMHFKSKLDVSRDLVALGVSVLIAYVSFSMMTGELHSVYPTLLFLGVLIKIIYILERNNIKTNIANP